MFNSNYYIYIVVGLLILCLLTVLIIRKRRSRSSSQENYPAGEQLYVGNLPYQINSHNLKEIFAQYGEVATVRVIKNTRTGRSKGFAFVTYADCKDAKKALSANGETIEGRSIVVRMAKPR